MSNFILAVTKLGSCVARMKVIEAALLGFDPRMFVTSLWSYLLNR